MLNSIQDGLNFAHWKGYPQFSTDKGLGRTALIATALGSAMTFHSTILCLTFLHTSGFICISFLDRVDSSRVIFIFQWCAYIIVLCIFHTLEFFVTALYNPTVTKADSFMVNHSKSYTAAVMISWCEFWLRALILPNLNYGNLCMMGIVLVFIGQCARSLAMVTCGESFNHLIQNVKRDNHKLVTSGM